MLQSLIPEPAAGAGHLSAEDCRLAVEALVDATVPAEVKADFLCRLALKGETVEEIAAFAVALREKAVEPPLDAATRSRVILDVCGTGGDRLNTFNISTTVALICSAAGIAVAKHGNRAITSQSGSADVLEELGVPIDLSPADAARSLAERDFAFFFAPNYHPAFKHIAPARRLCAERGQRTIFNYLGPLLNPARPTAQLIGVPRPELCDPVARVLQSLGVRRGLVVSGRVPAVTATGAPAYLDELSTLGENVVAEFYQERGFNCSVLGADGFAIRPAGLDDLRGGDRRENAAIVRRIISGEDRGPRRDAVLLNAAAALLVADRVRSLVEGWELAEELIDGGRAQRRLEELAVGPSNGAP
ncbi:MAG TPA: anthranilate phosphoribosyltransferase [Verrucomicrobia bacterium]|nr:anthranilate phosphoribosyltransferase [Verrucomicrobiota bacterium]HOB33868.1 anthranilate phosphoribosyltransferase [Verrucomicrobiota bacterium]HOP98215.1 anthranilate phosphoribosyltransferase [Verrucomicrobiota bacterium]